MARGPVDDAIRKELGQALAEVRRRVGVTQTQLAERLGDGYSQRQLSHYETGRGDMSVVALLEIAAALEMQPGELCAELSRRCGSDLTVGCG